MIFLKNRPKNIDEFLDKDWDYVITVCDNAKEVVQRCHQPCQLQTCAEADLKAQQQRGTTQEQQRQLADVSWTGLKGTAAARGAEAGTPPDVISEARKAIVGGETNSKRAQRIAALARAFVDGRQVSIDRRIKVDGRAHGHGLGDLRLFQ